MIWLKHFSDCMQNILQTKELLNSFANIWNCMKRRVVSEKVIQSVYNSKVLWVFFYSSWCISRIEWKVMNILVNSFWGFSFLSSKTSWNNIDQAMVNFYYPIYNTFQNCMHIHHTLVGKPILTNANLCLNGHLMECWLIFVTYREILEKKL